MFLLKLLSSGENVDLTGVCMQISKNNDYSLGVTDFLGFIIFSFEANYHILDSQFNLDRIDSLYINLHYLPGSE